MAQTIKNNPDNEGRSWMNESPDHFNSYEMQYELLQPWSTFVMATKLPDLILEKMIRISDEIIENKKSDSDSLDAGQIKDQFHIDLKILEQEEVMEFFTEACRNFVIEAFCQSQPTNRERILKEEWRTRLDDIWINSQKDYEYFPLHHHVGSISAVMYLKIPEFLPSLFNYNLEDDGAISFTSNSCRDPIWGIPNMLIHPEVGDFFIFPSAQQHQVHPFRTPDGKGERRSVSLNARFTSKSEQEFHKERLQAGDHDGNRAMLTAH